jgi:hypothetical protein
MDGYGPPSSKSPFGGHDDKKPDGKEDLDGELVGGDDKGKVRVTPLQRNNRTVFTFDSIFSL